MKAMHNSYGIYYETNLNDLIDPFNKYLKEKKFLDLGSGKGKVICLAQGCGAHVTGIEVEQELYMNSHLKDKVILGNIFDTDWSEYDVIYYYLLGSADQAKIIDRLKTQCKGYFFLYYKGVAREFISEFRKEIKVKLDFDLIDEFDNLDVYRVRNTI